MLPEDDLQPLLEEQATFSDEEGTITWDENGNIIVSEAGADDVPPGESEHFSNLAGSVEEGKLSEIGQMVSEAVDIDIRSREPWMRMYRKGLELLGLLETPAPLDIKGASKAVHPLLAEACVQFNADSMGELFPAGGPVKAHIIGFADKAKREQADRVEMHMNYQLTQEDKYYYRGKDKMMMYLPWAGHAFSKCYHDHLRDLNTASFLSAEQVVIPYSADDLQSATRITQIIYKSRTELERLEKSGLYIGIEDLPAQPDCQEAYEQLREIHDQIDSRENPGDTRYGGLYMLYESHTYIDVDGEEKPYIVTIEASTKKVIGLYRNWEEEDEKERRIDWFVDYGFIPNPSGGYYFVGFVHLLGGLGAATTGAMRGLLDAAAAANFQGGFMPKLGTRMTGDMTLEFGKYKQTQLNPEELRNAFYTPPFKEPSMALFQMLQFLQQSGQRFASTTDVAVGEAPNTGPVGTTLALIEQTKKVIGQVQRRLHQSLQIELQMIAKLNYMWLPTKYPFEVRGIEQETLRADYDGRIDIVPVSDPNIFSSTQRIAQAQAVVQLRHEFPGKLNEDEVLARTLTALKIQDWEDLIADNSPTRADPVTENQMVMVHAPVKVFSDQDDDSHVIVHKMFLAELAMEDEELATTVAPIMQAHIAEHIANAYRKMMSQAIGVDIPLFGESDEEYEQLPAEVENQIAQSAAQIAQESMQQLIQQQQEQAQAQQEAAMQEQMQQEQMRQAMQDAQAQATMQREEAKTQADIEREDAEFMADEARREAAFEAEQARKREDFEMRQRENEARIAQQEQAREQGSDS